MICSNCMNTLRMSDEVHVTEGTRPKYFHSYCVGDNKIDHVIPVKVKEFRKDSRRTEDKEAK